MSQMVCLHSISFLLIVILFKPIRVNPQLLNAIQLGLKNLLDNVIPDVDMALPVQVQDLQIPSIGIPTGNNQVVPLGCPVCQPLNPVDLTGVWYQMYANDNFIRNHLIRMAAVSEASSASADQESAGSESPSAQSTMMLGMKLLEPARMPVCVRVDVGEPINYGFTMDFPVLITYHVGVPRGRAMQVVGRLRPASQGYLLMVGTGAAQYRVKLCITTTNLPRHEGAQHQFNSQNEHLSNPYSGLPNTSTPRLKRLANSFRSSPRSVLVDRSHSPETAFYSLTRNVRDVYENRPEKISTYSQYLASRIDKEEEQLRLSRISLNQDSANVGQSTADVGTSGLAGNGFQYKPIIGGIQQGESTKTFENYPNEYNILPERQDESKIFDIYDHNNTPNVENIPDPLKNTLIYEEYSVGGKGVEKQPWNPADFSTSTLTVPQFAKFPNQNIVPIEYFGNNHDLLNDHLSTSEPPSFNFIQSTSSSVNISQENPIRSAGDSNTDIESSGPERNLKDNLATSTPATTTGKIIPETQNLQTTTEFPEILVPTIPIYTQFPPPDQPSNDLFPVFPSGGSSIFSQSASSYIIFAEMNGFPSCQNHLVLATDRADFFRHWDEAVLEILRRHRANTDINPVLYTGCPYGME